MIHELEHEHFALPDGLALESLILADQGEVPEAG
jgi:hypothetical protein